ncbi:hypothetical protein CEXT_131311 [Caerostris extrusa]|uniref:Uncharacterized protein n=1 Tax=Caerostris extrusa TaxID=172846 RepID=A0AAV4PLR0_CAEEX|nr:hypothetical protein CEXT_131311 [Caerostris extrusa]
MGCLQAKNWLCHIQYLKKQTGKKSPNKEGSTSVMKEKKKKTVEWLRLACQGKLCDRYRKNKKKKKKKLSKTMRQYLYNHPEAAKQTMESIKLQKHGEEKGYFSIFLPEADIFRG